MMQEMYLDCTNFQPWLEYEFFFFLSDMNISLQLKRNVFSLIPLVVIFASGPSINDIPNLGGICQKVTLLHQPI